MSWRTEVRKQINKAKSKRTEHRINKRIIESNERIHKEEILAKYGNSDWECS